MSPITIRFGGYQGPASVHTRAGHALGKALADRLGDAVAFDFEENIVAKGHKAADLLSLTEAGELDGCYFSSSYLAGRVPELGIFDQHFVVPDRERAYALLDGALGERLARQVAETTGYVALGAWDNGLRNISNGRHPIRTPQDCRSLTLRTLANEDHRRVFRALGFEPIAIDVRDLPEAVASGRVAAQENPLTNIYNFGIFETHRHITMTRHLLGVALVLFNRAAVEAWPAEVRAGVEAAVAEATAAQRGFAAEDDVSCAERMAAAGVEILELSVAEREAFAAATRPAVDEMRARFAPDLVAAFDHELAATS